MKLRSFRTLQSFLMAGVGFFLLERVWSGKLALYINQRYTWLILLAGFGLIALALTVFNHRAPVWLEKDGLLEPEMAPAKGKLRLGIFSLILVLGLLIPETSLGAKVAETRGVSASVPLTAGGSTPETLTLAPNQRSVLEWLWAFDETDTPAAMVGEAVDVEGFTFDNAALPEGDFMVGRFIITCCVADATAIGIAVHPPEGQDVPNGWVRIKGTMTVTNLNGSDALLIEADQITSIPEPDQPYLYP